MNHESKTAFARAALFGSLAPFGVVTCAVVVAAAAALAPDGSAKTYAFAAAIFITPAFGLLGYRSVISSPFVRADKTGQRMRNTMTSLLVAMDARDDRTTSIDRALIERELGPVTKAFGLSSAQTDVVLTTAMLCEVGKIGIPNEILHKPGGLNDHEWEVMRRAPEIGARILADIPGFEQVARAVRHVHERWDGGGYPDGLSGEDIPMASRIVLPWLAYHAMVSDRPYRLAQSPTVARAELVRHSESQFDSEVVDVLLEQFVDTDSVVATVPVDPAIEGFLNDRAEVGIVSDEEYSRLVLRVADARIAAAG
jgi:hypothetical protein